MINGAEAMVQCLKAEGVTRIFGIPGVAIAPFYEALYKMKYSLEAVFDRNLNKDDSSIMKAVILGDKSFMDEETRELLNWTVKFDYIEEDKPYTFECSWWEFIKAINEKIAEATSSDDKKLGYFFCKPKEKNSTTIDEERFVGKVVFYLWNDVFKDEENPIFKVTEGKGEPSFDAFYKEDEEGETIVDTLALRTFMHKVFGENKDLYTEIAKSEE